MLLEMIENICQSNPESVAVVDTERRISYGTLVQQSNRLAQMLIQSNIATGTVVTVYSRRTVDIIVCMIGIMRAGMAYTIVEDDGNQEENLARLESINADYVICEPHHYETLTAKGYRAMTLEASAAISEDAQDSPSIDAADVAYILYTSGSTGKPKGVEVTHGNVAHYTHSIAERLAIPAGLRYAHVSTLAADLGNTSLFLSLATGGSLYLVDEKLKKDPAGMFKYLADNRIEFLKITPSHWKAVAMGLQTDVSHGLQLEYLLLGGEALHVGLARNILNSGCVKRLVNHYGPTETTVGVTVNPVVDLQQLEAIDSGSVPIGKPMGETVLLIKTDEDKFEERNVRGELYIGGPSVARGYVNNSDASTKNFVRMDTPSGESMRFYKSGDFVAVDEDGVVQFLGRVDRQVKVNGYRVELEHIENVLRRVPDVTDAAVFFPEVRGRNRIVAALRITRDEENFDWLKNELAALVPAYMVPTIFLALERFPRNDNGKTHLKELQIEVEELLSKQTARGVEDSKAACQVTETRNESPLFMEIRKTWSACLRKDGFSDNDNFFEVGGDSLDAIQLVAELQVKGFDITAHTFLENPTVSGLAAAIEAAEQRAAAQHDIVEQKESRTFSAAQDLFLKQQLVNADHYNQAFLLECSENVEVDILRKVIIDLVDDHPSLRAAYGEDSEGAIARLVATDDAGVLETSFLAESSETAIRQHIDEVGERTQAAIRLGDGALFKAHLFKFSAKRDHLLLVAHHVAVDVISWRIIISEIVRLYNAYSSGAVISLPKNRNTFWGWVDHLDRHRETLRNNAADWLQNIERIEKQSERTYRPDNTEGNAKSLWLGFSVEESRALLTDLVLATDAPFHQVLLAVYAYCLARERGDEQIVIDVESHGRVVLDNSIDVSRVVGWHTSTFPMAIDVSNADIKQVIADIVKAMDVLPDLGVAYGVLDKDRALPTPVAPSADCCYNYLGEFKFNHDDHFGLSPSRYAIGHARGADNYRGHDLKLSARIIEGQLVADLSFSTAQEQPVMASVMQNIRRHLLLLAGREVNGEAPLYLEPGTRTGVISYVPEQLIAESVEEQRREYQAVLLTGATGYVGAYVLKELLAQSDAHVYCLVRPKGGQDVSRRLQEMYDWYFPNDHLVKYSDRYTVVEGDVTHKNFGLTTMGYDQLCADVDAIYHFAADTRLFGSEEEFQLNNVQSVQSCINFASRKRVKDLHYMSTLAVCGVNPRKEAVAFTEASMDIGQEFQNHYESTKFMAEHLVKGFDLAGAHAFIYRSGNVSGDSISARFQKNAGDNRLMQFLAACVKLGELPEQLGDPVVLSPVDEVAAGIVAISLDPDVKGGMFHVDSMHKTPMDKFFQALERAGVSFTPSQHTDFASLFGAMREYRDQDLALGYFWATRKPRNVNYNHERTHRVLARYGYSFTEVDDAWLDKMIRLLIEEGVFGEISATPELRSLSA